LQDTTGNLVTSPQTVSIYGYSDPSSADPLNKYLELFNYTTGDQQCGATFIAPYVTDCKQIYSQPSQLSWMTASDTLLNNTNSSCSSGTHRIAQVRRTYGGSGCGGFQAIDPNNNTQVLWLQDTKAPTLTVTNYNWSSCVLPTTPNSVVYSDSCSYSSVTLTYVDSILYDSYSSCPLNQTTRIVSRKWTATDSCGNTAQATQIITVIDKTAPTFTIANNTCTCTQVTDTIGATTCNCGSPQSVADDCNISPNPSDRNSYVTSGCSNRTWTVTDRCGNSRVLTQYF